MRNDAPNNRRGFTLLETLVTIAVMTILLLIVNGIFVVNYDIVVKQTSKLDSDGGVTFASRQISELARGAAAVEASHTINGTTYASSSTTLVLQIPAIDASNNPIADAYDYVAISRDPSDATRIIADALPASGSRRPSGKRLVTGYNVQLVFRYNAATVSDATRVSVYIVNQKTVRNSTATSRAWTSLFLRNYDQ